MEIVGGHEILTATAPPGEPVYFLAIEVKERTQPSRGSRIVGDRMGSP